MEFVPAGPDTTAYAQFAETRMNEQNKCPVMHGGIKHTLSV